MHLVLEHEGNKASHLRARGMFDAQWTDDWHHCMHVLLTGEHEGYYEDFQDAARPLARCMAEGFAYQGEMSPHSGEPRGEPSAHLPTTAFVICLQNHDQIGNRAFGDRLTTLADPQALRAATALLLLSAVHPDAVHGRGVGHRAPFLFFTDHNQELAKLVREGRRREFAAFRRVRRSGTARDDPRSRTPPTLRRFRARPGGRRRRTMPRFCALLATCARGIARRRGIPGCRSEGAEAIGRKRRAGALAHGRRRGADDCDQSRTRTPVPIGPLAGEMLFESHARRRRRAGAGGLPAAQRRRSTSGPAR